MDHQESSAEMNESQLVAPCCARCTHTASTPCPDLIACIERGPQCHDDDACRGLRAARTARARRGGDGMVLFVGAGTCGRANGALAVIDAIEAFLERRGLHVPVLQTGCVGYCQREVFVDLVTAAGTRLSYCDLSPENIEEFLHAVFVEGEPRNRWLLGRYDDESGEFADVTPLADTPFFARQTKVVLQQCGVVDPTSLDAALAAGAFRAAARALTTMTPGEVCDEVEESGLRGRGGAGFPTGRKWRVALDQPRARKYLVCNADEGDPGAFMDRAVLESDPFRVVEGMLIAAYAIGATQGYVYCRAEYPLAVERLREAIDQCRQAGLLGATSSAASSTSTSPSSRAPAPSCAARRRRSWRASRAGAACPGLARRTPPSAACTASLPCSTTWRRWPTCPPSWSTEPPGSAIWAAAKPAARRSSP